MNIWGKIGLTALVVAGGSQLFAATRAKKVSDNLNIKLINPRIHKLDANPFGGGIEIRTEVQLQNPTNGSLKITQPYIQILSNGSVVSATAVSNKEFTIKPLSQLNIDTVSLKIDWTTILSRLAALKYGIPKELTVLQKIAWLVTNYNQIINKLNLSMKYTTYANGLFYSEIEKIKM